jgi:hypothetical protein
VETSIQECSLRVIPRGHPVAADRTTWLVNFQSRDGADPVAAEYDVIADGKGARAHPYRATTKLLTSQGNKNLDVHALRFGFYSLVQAVASAVLLVMLRRMISHDQAPGFPEPVAVDNAWQTYGLLIGFGLSIPVFFVTTYGWVVWIAGPLLVHQLYRFRHGRQRRPGTT